MDESLDRTVNAVSEAHHGVFARRHLDHLGVSPTARRHRLEQGRWEVVHEGVYRVVGAPLTWHGRLSAACLAGGSRAVASHRSAARLWSIPGGSTDAVEITCPRWRRTQVAGLVVHESRHLVAADATKCDGVPVTTIERTLFDLAAVLRPTTLDLAIANSLRRGLTTMESLEMLLRRVARRGRAGSTAFRAALTCHSTGGPLSESEAERLLLRLLERHGLPTPVAQHEIRSADGRSVARADLAYPDLRIAIEYDSYAHHLGADALVRDSARRNAVVALGWLPITATARDLRTGGAQLVVDLRRARAQRTRAGFTPSRDAN